jgi:sugar phosphate isomerase/epimerase
MNDSSRRDFIKATGGLLGFALAGSPLNLPKDKMLLSFSTLGCPKWTFPTIVDFAVNNQYNGIEIRGIDGQLDLPKCPEFSSPDKISSTRMLVEGKGLRFVDLGSSAEMHHPEGPERQKNLDEAKRFIDLAKALGCPYIRVFPNKLPKDDQRTATIDLIIKGLIELGDYAKDSKVRVLMESHGDAVQTDELKRIMESTSHTRVGMVWDIVNMWSVTKEPPAQVYEKLGKYVYHTHIKDLRFVDGKEQYVLLGTGEAPIFDAIEVLRKGGYKGYYSFEWEKLWHPEIAEPEIALADYPKKMKQHFN